MMANYKGSRKNVVKLRGTAELGFETEKTELFE